MPYVVVVIDKALVETRTPAADEASARATWEKACGTAGVLAASVQRTEGPHSERFVPGCEWSALAAQSASPVGPDELRAMARVCLGERDALVGARSWALVLLAASGVLRPSEIADLGVVHVKLRAHHVVISAGPREITLHAAADDTVCPVVALSCWMAVREEWLPASEGPCFFAIESGRARRLRHEEVSAIVSVTRNRAGALGAAAGEGGSDAQG
jgi:hypothetical protein